MTLWPFMEDHWLIDTFDYIVGRSSTFSYLLRRSRSSWFRLRHRSISILNLRRHNIRQDLYIGTHVSTWLCLIMILSAGQWLTRGSSVPSRGTARAWRAGSPSRASPPSTASPPGCSSRDASSTCRPATMLDDVSTVNAGKTWPCSNRKWCDNWDIER